MSDLNSTTIEQYLHLAYTSATNGKWRDAGAFALCAAAHLEESKSSMLQLQYDYCMMAADFVAKETIAPDANGVTFGKMLVDPTSFEKVREKAFRPLFTSYSTASATFHALQYAYMVWTRMSDSYSGSSRALLPRMLQLLVDHRMFNEAEYYANAWYRRALNNSNYALAALATNTTFDVFSMSGDHNRAARHLFKTMADLQYNTTFAECMKGMNGTTTYNARHVSLCWALAILAMAIPGEHIEASDANTYLKAALANSCVAALSKQDPDGTAKLCKHHPDNDRIAVIQSKSTSSYDVYFAVRFLDLLRALIVKRDRKAVTQILTAFCTDSALSSLVKCGKCPAIIGSAKPVITFTPDASSFILDALFARPPAALLKQLSDLDVNIALPTLSLTPTTHTEDGVLPDLKSHHCAKCSTAMDVSASASSAATIVATSSTATAEPSSSSSSAAKSASTTISPSATANMASNMVDTTHASSEPLPSLVFAFTPISAALSNGLPATAEPLSSSSAGRYMSTKNGTAALYYAKPDQTGSFVLVPSPADATHVCSIVVMKGGDAASSASSSATASKP